jgi:hypothetical protein
MRSDTFRANVSAFESRHKRHDTIMIRVWAKTDPYGTELARVHIEGTTLSARGLAIGIQPVPYRLGYVLTTVDQFVTHSLTVRAQGDGWHRALILERSDSGAWSCTPETHGSAPLPPPGGDLRALNGALDCDLAFSPLTNTLPVLRHALHRGGGPLDFLMAWVSVPDLAVTPSPQRYTFVRHDPNARIVRFESLDDAFIAHVAFDDDGLVVDYPGLARLVS